VQELLTQVAVALATPVEQAVPHAPQWLGLLVVSTQVLPLQRISVPGQPETQVELEQYGVPPSALQARPQPPQLALFVAVSTHAPPHSVKPELQAKLHAPLMHAAVALPTPVEQVCPHEPQLFGSVVVSEQPLGQSVGAVAGGQLEAHTYKPPEAVQ